MRKTINVIIIFCMLSAFIPFGNFASAEKLPDNLTNSNSLKNDSLTSENQTKKRIELEEERTEFSKTFDNLDGTLSTEITQVPQHFMNEQGQWKDIQNNLVSNNNGGYANKENKFSVEFDEKINNESTGLKLKEDEYELNLQLTNLVNESEESLQPSTGIVEDNQITYSEIFDEISATYTVGENFIKEDIIIDNPPKNGLPEKFTYTLDLNGLTYEEIDNKIYLYDAITSEPIFMIEAPFMMILNQ